MSPYSRAVLIASMAAFSECIRQRQKSGVAKRQQDALLMNSTDAWEAPQMQSVQSVQSDAKIQSCTCSFNRYRWQQWPKSTSTGAGCIGGCGGSNFQIDRYGSIIKTLVVWFNHGNSNDYIKAIRVTYEDGHSEQKGNPTGTPQRFTFQTGEWVVGALRLSGNGIGTRLGSIAFDTNLGNRFDVGKRDPRRYYFATGGTASRPVHIAGLSGSSGSDIDRMGVIFWKPIFDTSYLSINYPTLSTVSRLTSPTEVRTRTFCNDGPDPLPATERTLEEVVTIGSETCLTSSLETQFTVNLTISGGIPVIKEGEASAAWSTTVSVGIKNCQTATSTKKETLRFPSFQLQPYRRVRQTFTQWSGQLSKLPWNGVLRVSMRDGTIFDRRVEGFYRGVDFNDVHLAYNTERNVTEC